MNLRYWGAFVAWVWLFNAGLLAATVVAVHFDLHAFWVVIMGVLLKDVTGPILDRCTDYALDKDSDEQEPEEVVRV